MILKRYAAMQDNARNLDLILLNIGYSDLNANWNWEKVYSPFARIYYVKEGEAKIKINSKTYLLKPNHLYLTPPFTLHDNECNSNFSLFYIHFYENATNKESLFDKYSFPVEVDAVPLDLSLVERLQQSNPDRYLRYFDPRIYDNQPTFSQYIADNNKMPLHSIIETQGILLQLIARFLQQKKPKLDDNTDIRISNILQYIHENIDKDIYIEELTKMSNITKDHLIRKFKKETGHTPVRYIIAKKMERAQLLLLTTDMPIKNIALELSLDNTSYFNRLFKQYTDKTPSKYREEYSK